MCSRFFVEAAKSDISPDFFGLRRHKCTNDIRSGSNKFPLGTPFYLRIRNPKDLFHLHIQASIGECGSCSMSSYLAHAHNESAV